MEKWSSLMLSHSLGLCNGGITFFLELVSLWTQATPCDSLVNIVHPSAYTMDRTPTPALSSSTTAPSNRRILVAHETFPPDMTMSHIRKTIAKARYLKGRQMWSFPAESESLVKSLQQSGGSHVTDRSPPSSSTTTLSYATSVPPHFYTVLPAYEWLRPWVHGSY